MDTLMYDIIATQEFRDPMMVISSDNEEYKEMFDDIIGTDYIRALMAFPEVGISADMIIIVEATDTTHSERLDLMTQYMLDRQEAYKGYAPEEAERFDDVRFSTYGKYTIMLLVPDIKTADTFVFNALNME